MVSRPSKTITARDAEVGSLTGGKDLDWYVQSASFTQRVSSSFVSTIQCVSIDLPGKWGIDLGFSSVEFGGVLPLKS